MKIRLDQYLVQNGLVQSRERAKALIMAGVVFVNQQKVDKAGEMIKEDAVVEVRGHDIGYVSRGGLKLEKAMKCFPLTTIISSNDFPLASVILYLEALSNPKRG